MYSVLNTLSEYTYFYILTKFTSFTFIQMWITYFQIRIKSLIELFNRAFVNYCGRLLTEKVIKQIFFYKLIGNKLITNY